MAKQRIINIKANKCLLHPSSIFPYPPLAKINKSVHTTTAAVTFIKGNLNLVENPQVILIAHRIKS